MTIRSHANAVIKDIQGINDIEFDVNWDSKNKNSIKVTLAGKVSFISKDDLWNFVFSIVQTSQQQRMIPVIKDEIIRYQKQHSIELQKDMKKGEVVVANCAVNVKKEVDDAIRRELEEENSYQQKGIKTPYYLTDDK